MGIWNQFFAKTSLTPDFSSQLHEKIFKRLPSHSEENVLIITCVAGLLARVAFIDFDFDARERESMSQALKELDVSDEEVQVIIDIAIDEIKQLSGLENHLYCYPISEMLSVEKRYQIVQALFNLAASDDGVSEKESEEIRQINTGLLLEHKHFISARAHVLDKLDSLK